MLTPTERSLRARIAAFELHAAGGTNTGPARAALEQKFLDQVDPDRVLPEAERQRRAAYARQAHFSRLTLAAAKARRKGAADAA